MEFNEKLQQLRTGKNLTQEQLAEQLYVSRTAISKWESGKGYPNIESLKCISKFFSVTIDELLSGEELITLAETENRSNLKKIYSFIYGILDMMKYVVNHSCSESLHRYLINGMLIRLIKRDMDGWLRWKTNNYC